MKIKKTKPFFGLHAILFIYSMMLSFAIVAGRQVHYVKMRSKMNENFISFDIFSILKAILILLIIYPLIEMLIEYINNHMIKTTTNINTPKHLRRMFFAFWGVIFIAWIPHLLSFYPGGIVGDGAITIEAALKPGMPKENHWVVLYILVIKFFLYFGAKLGLSLSKSIYLYVIVESLAYSAVCAMVGVKLKKHKIPNIFVYGSVLIYALSGFFASYGMGLWKDGIFSAAIVLIVLMLWEYPFGKKPSIAYCIKISLLMLFACFLRNNGLYTIVVCFVAFVILLRREYKRLILSCFAVVAITIIVQGPVYDCLGIKKDSLTQSFSLPIQQIAATVNSGGGANRLPRGNNIFCYS